MEVENNRAAEGQNRQMRIAIRALHNAQRKGSGFAG